MLPSSPTVYDQIGHGYRAKRRPDPRLSAQVLAALGDARTVLNVGAGAGSYEPVDRAVVALEPSIEMVRQRASTAPVVRGVAEALPFRDGQFDAVMAMLTLHHWVDQAAGLAELCRVAQRQVVFTFDRALNHDFWLVREYLPEIGEMEDRRNPSLEWIADALGADRVETLWVPHDCTDGFQCAYWRRPERYLEPEVQQSISTIAQLDPAIRRRGLNALAADLESGAWHERHADLLDEEQGDFGYRLLIAG